MTEEIKKGECPVCKRQIDLSLDQEYKKVYLFSCPNCGAYGTISIELVDT